MILCFELTMRILLVTHWSFSGFWAVLTLTQEFLSSHTPCWWGDYGRQNKDSWPKQAKEISHTIWCHPEQITLRRVDWHGGCCCFLWTGWELVKEHWAIAFCIFYFVYSSIIIIIFLFCDIQLFSVFLFFWFCLQSTGREECTYGSMVSCLSY